MMVAPLACVECPAKIAMPVLFNAPTTTCLLRDGE
jgi:hypothetical protein